MLHYEDLLAELIGDQIQCRFLSDDVEGLEAGKLKLLVLDNKSGMQVSRSVTCADIVNWEQLNRFIAEIQFMLAIQKHSQQQKRLKRFR